MKIEKLSKGKYIKTSIIVLVVISIFGVIFINRSKAKYRVTQSIQIVNGEVNYKVPDLNVLAINVETAKDTGNYTSTTVPLTGNYEINTDKSYCTIGSSTQQLKTIPMKYEDGKVYIGITDKNTKCYVWLDIAKEISGTELLGKYTVNSTSDGCPAYEDAPSVTSVQSSGSLLCRGMDDFGDTYYFRGNPTNNWVKLGNFYWRIVRFNGNGSIRLIYSGSGSPATSGADTQTKTLAYNSSNNSANYVKYKNGSTNSTIKNELDSWYTTNLTSYKDKLDGKAGFCNDADIDSTSGSTRFYKPYRRIYTYKKPTFKCGTPTTNLYTTTGNTNGNQQLGEIPIGLITIDEASFAGGLDGSNNTGYYLYTGQTYWTMSPYYFGDSSVGRARMFSLYSDGYFSNPMVDDPAGVRPVINLKADTTFIGEGISTNPYEVII